MSLFLAFKPIERCLSLISQSLAALLLVSIALPASGQRNKFALNHETPTDTGSTPRGSSDTGAIVAATVLAAAVGFGVYEVASHHGEKGPDVPKAFDMTDFKIKGLARANWPVVLDLMTDTPGSVQIDVSSQANSYQGTIHTPPTGRRGLEYFMLPASFDSKPQSAIYHVKFIPAGGTSAVGASASSVSLRLYGIGAGPKAIGSIALDDLTFSPGMISRKSNETADYSFHAHSAFDGTLSDFVLVESSNGHLIVKRDAEDKQKRPIGEGELAKEVWSPEKDKGKDGQHMLQIKAWRGLENGGDWVVAWSPDIVDVEK